MGFAQTIIESGVELHGDLAPISIGRTCIIGQQVVLRPPDHSAQGCVFFPDSSLIPQ
jgi:carbonic anhydrase/acetyltransferase-like protein (isoleucine patch superfamily)